MYPRRLSLNPPLPVGVPWQAPILQPAWLKAGITSLRNPTGAGLLIPSTRTTALVSAPAILATIVAVPSPLGATCPLGETAATSGLRLAHSTLRVRSIVEPSAASGRGDQLAGRPPAGDASTRPAGPRPSGGRRRRGAGKPRPRGRAWGEHWGGASWLSSGGSGGGGDGRPGSRRGAEGRSPFQHNAGGGGGQGKSNNFPTFRCPSPSCVRTTSPSRSESIGMIRPSDEIVR